MVEADHFSWCETQRQINYSMTARISHGHVVGLRTRDRAVQLLLEDNALVEESLVFRVDYRYSEVNSVTRSRIAVIATALMTLGDDPTH
jgi:hypothetical protein